MPRCLKSRVVIRKPKVIYRDLGKDGPVGLSTFDENLAEISPAQSDRELFLTHFHETCGHLLLPDLTENQVIRLEKTMGVALWKCVCRLRRKWLKNRSKFE